jgi:hypothetical protein
VLWRQLPSRAMRGKGGSTHVQHQEQKEGCAWRIRGKLAAAGMKQVRNPCTTLCFRQ